MNTVIQKYQCNPEIVATELDDSLMMMSIEEGKYFELNPVSKRMWELFEEPNTFDGVVSILLEEYEVSKADCEEQVKQHIDELLVKKIIFKV